MLLYFNEPWSQYEWPSTLLWWIMQFLFEFYVRMYKTYSSVFDSKKNISWISGVIHKDIRHGVHIKLKSLHSYQIPGICMKYGVHYEYLHENEYVRSQDAMHNNFIMVKKIIYNFFFTVSLLLSCFSKNLQILKYSLVLHILVSRNLHEISVISADIQRKTKYYAEVRQQSIISAGYPCGKAKSAWLSGQQVIGILYHLSRYLHDGFEVIALSSL